MHHNTKQFGLLAAQTAPEGFLSSRLDFIGRAGTVWQPRALETLAFLKPCQAEAFLNFDPVGSLLLGLPLAPGATGSIRLLMGCAGNQAEVAEWDFGAT